MLLTLAANAKHQVSYLLVKLMMKEIPRCIVAGSHDPATFWLRGIGLDSVGIAGRLRSLIDLRYWIARLRSNAEVVSIICTGNNLPNSLISHRVILALSSIKTESKEINLVG